MITKLEGDWVINQPPPVVGHWNVCGTSFSVHVAEQPSKWHQFWCAYLIGWKWIDHDSDRTD